MFKLRNIFMLLFLIATSVAFGNDLLLKAEKAYEKREYKKAIETYEELIKDGYTSDNLFYNLGNAYYRNNQLGKAIYNYERAKKINPYNEDVKNNLTLAYSKTIDKIEVKENFFISAVKTNVLSSFTTTAWAWLTIGASFLFFLMMYLFIAGSSVLLKRISFFASLVLVIAFFITYFLGNSAKKAKEENSFAIITATETKVYTEPTSTANSKFGLHEGTRVRIVELNADWILIKLENGNEGWLRLNDVGVF
ncbi:MAG TPA: tetratricopeptide repeat protein [Bacteroidia bacterium]|nr:tetratricopeptide repeat protein [Bacteroidia bacterium]